MTRSPLTLARPIDAELVASVLTELAEIASETLELQDVFDRVAASVRRVIPLDKMGIVRIVDGDRAVLHASSVLHPSMVPCTTPCEHYGPMPLTSWSPRMRPTPTSKPRVDDARLELNPAFPFDARALEQGVRSALWEPFRSASPLQGGVFLASLTPFTYTDEHQEVLKPIAALLGSAVDHWLLWDTERRRRERLDRIETVLVTLAGSLEVRDVFAELSADVRAVLPHDLMVLTELDPRARTIRVISSAGDGDFRPGTEPVPLTEDELARRNDFEIVDDIQSQVPADTERKRKLLSSGMRSWLRVPVLLSGEVQGGLSLFQREPSQYTWEDAEVARRLADRIALMRSHQRLAEEARVSAETRERAARLEARVSTLTQELESRGRHRVVGQSASWRDSLRQVGLVAGSDTSVLVTGESGTGKEVIASLLHQGSPRAGKPFVAINCAALPEQLLESELFGHEKGAFTGAISTKIGRIEQAEGGTLFLDEVAEMSPLVQAKLLRVLEAREFQRVGATRTQRADVRIIAATNRDLAAGIARQTFREDLYYRLNVFQIHLAPLRERREDILPLAEAFLDDLGRTMARPAAGISKDAREWLLEQRWPGNVRELRNAIERAILLCDGGLITHDHLPAPMRLPDAPAANAPSTNGHASPAEPATVELATMEREMIERALDRVRGNKTQAARMLGLSRAQLYWRLERYGIR